MSKSVCVPVDDSPGSQRAVDWACKNAVNQRSRLSLLCVRSVLSDPFAVEAAGTTAEGTNSQEFEASVKACDQTLKQYRQAVVAAGVSPSQVVTAQVEPLGGASGVGESIVKYVETTNQDMLVLGSRGMGAVKRAMLGMLGLGSVSDWVVNHAHCPVVVVKPPS